MDLEPVNRIDLEADWLAGMKGSSFQKALHLRVGGYFLSIFHCTKLERLSRSSGSRVSRSKYQCSPEGGDYLGRAFDWVPPPPLVNSSSGNLLFLQVFHDFSTIHLSLGKKRKPPYPCEVRRLVCYHFLQLLPHRGEVDRGK